MLNPHPRTQTRLDYRRLAEAIPALLWLCDADGQMLYANRRFCDFTGFDIASLAPGEVSARLLHPDDVARVAEAWRRVSDGSGWLETEYRVRSRDGGYRWVLASVVPLRDDRGRVRQWLGTATDIDDQKRRETVLRTIAEASELLVESFDVEQRLAQLATLVVPDLAQWCGIYVLRGEDVLEAIGVGHADPERARIARDALRRVPAHLSAAGREALTLGRTRVDCIDENDASAGEVSDEAHLYIMGVLGLRRSICIPLHVNGQSFGFLQFANSASGRMHDKHEVHMLEMLAKRISIALDNARIYERERRVASTFQHAALPRTLPEIPGVSLSAVYNPAQSEAEIGGDWYDAFLVDEHHLVVSIGDVSGKGLEAAVLMGTIRQSIRVAALEGLDCVRIVQVADKALQLEYPGHVASALVLQVDLRTRACRYVNAGHPPALVRSGDGSVCELLHTNLPLGIATARADDVGQIELDDDAMLLCYTDGLIEATRDVLEGSARLREVLASEAMLHTPNPARLVHDTVLDAGARDDVAILAISFGRNRHWSFDARDAQRAQGARSSFVRHLREEGHEASDFSGAEVIFGELIGNVVRYSPGPIDIDLEWTDEHPVLHVLDRGKAFTPAARLPDDMLSENGRGLFIVGTLGSELRVRPLPGKGNHVRVRLPVRRRRT